MVNYGKPERPALAVQKNHYCRRKLWLGRKAVSAGSTYTYYVGIVWRVGFHASVSSLVSSSLSCASEIQFAAMKKTA